jgi:hypothetical protein
MLRDMEAMDFYAEDELWKRLEDLMVLIRVKLEEVARRIK